MRLYLREGIDRITSTMTGLQRILVDLAGKEAGTIMPGYTHMQSAQPVTLGHHILAWNEMLERDFQRLRDCRGRVNVSPLGAAALAGTSYPIDRQSTADELGFGGVCANSLDAVSDRDFVIEFNAASALIMVHLSRIAEELVLWSTEGTGFVELGDAFCTGSSIMPQKKNPDVAELIRGKSGRVSGNLVALLMMMKGQPLAYNRDNQEDKEPLFMVPAIEPNSAAMRAAAQGGFSTATDLADYLVRLGLPFRDAHEVVGSAVAHCVDKGVDLSELDLETLQDFCSDIGEGVFEVLTLEGSVAARDHLGGTAPGQVTAAAKRARDRLKTR